MALHRVGLDQNRPLTFRRTRIQERAMLVLKPTSPSRHPENGEGATFIKNNDTAFITRPSLSFDGKRREMGRETTEGREKREGKKKREKKKVHLGFHLCLRESVRFIV